MEYKDTSLIFAILTFGATVLLFLFLVHGLNRTYYNTFNEIVFIRLFSYITMIGSGIFAGRTFVKNKSNRKLILTGIVIGVLSFGVMGGFVTPNKKVLTSAYETTDIQDPVEYETLHPYQKSEFSDLMNEESQLEANSLTGIDQIQLDETVYQLTRVTVENQQFQGISGIAYIVTLVSASVLVGLGTVQLDS